MPSDPPDDWERRKHQIVGLGERSFRKSYYPQLRQNRERLERFRTLLDRTSDFVVLVALPDGSVADANAAFGALVGVPAEALVGRDFAALGLAGAATVFADLQREAVVRDAAGEPPAHSLVVECGPPEAGRWLELSYRVALVDERSYGVVVGRDISERKRNEAMLADLLAEKAALLDNAMVGIAMLRQRRIVSCNRRFEEIFGYPEGSLAGHSTRLTYPSEALFAAVGEACYGALARGESFSGTLQLLRADGRPVWAELTGRPIGARQPDDASIWIVNDVTERREAEERARFLAHHDALTRLPNLVLLRDRVQQAIAFAERAATKVALMVVDLDRFKTVNDSLGHSVGDRLLVEVATRLLACSRDTDTVSRQGGDEFLLLLPGLADPDACTGVVGKIMLSLAEPFRIDGHELETTVSVGVALHPDDGADFESLLKNADTAMYRAKDAGRNTYRFFNAAMNEDAVEQLTMHFGLRRALDAAQFVLHYQPQVEIASGALVGAEALIRWNHPELGLVPPARFIPVAEESGLIVQIGAWVLREACREAARWQQAGLPPAVVAVNLSALQFKRGDIEQSVTRALAESGLDPAQLELELTESILIRDTETVLATVRRLKHMGIKLSIDDFGTGYSSLSYLKRFAVDKLKIDQSFVRGLATDAEDAAIVRAIVQMARSLGLRTIAEGVEDPQVLEHLRLYRCDEAQGFHFAAPLPAAEFVARYAPGR